MQAFVLIVLATASIAAGINPAILASNSALKTFPDKTKWTLFQCRDGLASPNDERVKEIKACKESTECNYLCQAGNLGLLNEDNSTTLKIYLDWAEAVLSHQPHLIQVAKEHITDCYQKYGEFIDLSDKQCVIGKQFADCSFAVVPKLKCAN